MENNSEKELRKKAHMDALIDHVKANTNLEKPNADAAEAGQAGAGGGRNSAADKSEKKSEEKTSH
jgi:hypothetical protein